MKPLRFIRDTVMGSDHLKIKKNCQDSLAFFNSPEFTVGFVADGMGDPIDSPFSEVGSRIVVKLAEELVTQKLYKTVRWRRKQLLMSNIFWMEVQNNLLNKIEEIATLMGGDYRKNIIHYFLFTLTGFVLTSEVMVVVGVGDGYFSLNGICQRVVEPSENNMPASLSYNLVESTLREVSIEEITLSVKWVVKTSEIESFVIATDGLRSLLIPKDEYFVFPSIYRFWETIDYFENEFALGWKLGELASEKRTIDWEKQVLVKQKPVIVDDLAVIIGSRV